MSSLILSGRLIPRRFLFSCCDSSWKVRGLADLMGKVSAKWKGKVIAECEEKDIVIVEGNSYFPPASVKKEFLVDSTEKSVCPWKGDCSYYDVKVDGSVNKAAAWYYPNPKPAANNIKGYIAFYKGVVVGGS